MADGLDLSRLSPGDAIAALRSYPRRYRALFAFEDDDDVEALVHRAGPDGRSAVDIVSGVARALAVIGQALQEVLSRDDAVLHPGVVDSSARTYVDAPASPTLESGLDHVDLEANAVADIIDRTDSGAWAREATVADGSGRTASALDLVHEAVRTGADGLRAIDVALRHARD